QRCSGLTRVLPVKRRRIAGNKSDRCAGDRSLFALRHLTGGGVLGFSSGERPESIGALAIVQIGCHHEQCQGERCDSLSHFPYLTPCRKPPCERQWGMSLTCVVPPYGWFFLPLSLLLSSAPMRQLQASYVV